VPGVCHIFDVVYICMQGAWEWEFLPSLVSISTGSKKAPMRHCGLFIAARVANWCVRRVSF
jgi:hypothetical protein